MTPKWFRISQEGGVPFSWNWSSSLSGYQMSEGEDYEAVNS
jgi:hypothetical protein